MDQRHGLLHVFRTAQAAPRLRRDAFQVPRRHEHDPVAALLAVGVPAPIAQTRVIEQRDEVGRSGLRERRRLLARSFEELLVRRLLARQRAGEHDEVAKSARFLRLFRSFRLAEGRERLHLRDEPRPSLRSHIRATLGQTPIEVEHVPAQRRDVDFARLHRVRRRAPRTEEQQRGEQGREVHRSAGSSSMKRMSAAATSAARSSCG